MNEQEKASKRVYSAIKKMNGTLKVRRASPEYDLYKAIATYMRLQYPKIMYRFDMAGNNLSKAQAGRNKAIQKPDEAWPDFFIAKPNFVLDTGFNHPGLFLELKPDGTKLTNKAGEWKDEHIAKQAITLQLLAWDGYMARFAIGFEEAKNIIDEYLK